MIYDEIIQAIAEVTVMIDGVAYAPVGFMAQELTQILVIWGLAFGCAFSVGIMGFARLLEGIVLLGRFIFSKIRRKKSPSDDSEHMEEIIEALHTMDPVDLIRVYNFVTTCRIYPD